MYFGAYPGGWKESCPWVTLGIFKYTGPDIQCPGAPGLSPVPEPLSCSWLYKLARCQDHLWCVQCWGGVVEVGEHICSADESCEATQKRGRAHENDLAGFLPLSALDPRSISIPFSLVGDAEATMAIKRSKSSFIPPHFIGLQLNSCPLFPQFSPPPSL